MVKLLAKTPCDGLLQQSIGSVELTEVEAGVLTSIMPYQGQEKALSAAAKEAHGMAWPAPLRATGKDGARLVWFGRGQALLMGPAPDPGLARFAALSDQSDAWTIVRLNGAGAEDVMARLAPVDLRPFVFKRGHTLRTDIMHMAGSITRLGEAALQVMVFRSMAATLVHDLKTAMEGVASRG